jgi:hypothetical protein
MIIPRGFNSRGIVLGVVVRANDVVFAHLMTLVFKSE